MASESQQVWLIEPADHPERWQEAEHRLVAELETAGFSVARREVHAPDQETLLRSLVNSEPIFASIVMLREGAGGAAFVWLSGAARVKRFAMSDVSSSRAAGAIALRVTEYLNMQVLTIAVPPPAPAPEEPALPAPAAAAGAGAVTPAQDPAGAADSKPVQRGLLWLGLGATLSSDSHNVAPSANLGVGVGVSSLFTLEGSAEVVVAPLSVDTDYGTTKVAATSARLVGTLQQQLGQYFSLGLGLGAGVLRLSADSEGAPGIVAQSDTTNTTLLLARLRLLLKTRTGFSVLGYFDPGVVVPAASIQADGRDVARLGRPWLSSTLAAGWSF